MFGETKEFIKSKVMGRKARAVSKALEKKMSSPKEMIKAAHRRAKREGMDFNKI